jgi:hypothetical protein
MVEDSGWWWMIVDHGTHTIHGTRWIYSDIYI